MPTEPPRNQKELDAHLYDARKDSLDAEFFNANEFKCHDGTPIFLLHPILLEWLDELRREFGPTRINSGFRTGAYNEKIGGSSNSRHRYGLAADVDCVEVTDPESVASWAERKGFGGIGRYNTFTHLDVWGEDRRWNNRNQTSL